MPTARDVMSAPPVYLQQDATLATAATRMAHEGAGALPVCGPDGRLVGMLSDRDIVVHGLARGRDPERCTVGDLFAGRGEVVTIGADDSLEETLHTMAEHQVRRLPVIDGRDLVGIVAQADLARACPPEQVGDLLAAISA